MIKNVKLIDICSPKQWKTISAKQLLKEGYPVYGANGIIGYYDKYTHEEQTILITCRGATCGTINLSMPKSYVNGNAMALDNLDPKVDIYFLAYFLKKRGLNDVISGSAQPQITKQGLKKLKIPLPPLAEQKKIAAILDEADKLRRLNQALLEKYDALTQSLFLDMFGDPVLNPKGWEKVKLKECNSKIGSGATPRGGKESYKEEGISLIRSMNVYDHRFKYKNLAFIDDEQARKLKNVIVEKEDVLFNITGASVCRCTIVPPEILPARVNQHVAILRPQKEKLNSTFLSYLLTSKNCKIELLGVGSNGATTREAITKEDLENFYIPMPPLPLQTQFAERLKKIETQKSQAQASLAKSEELFNSLLQRAFKGELV